MALYDNENEKKRRSVTRATLGTAARAGMTAAAPATAARGIVESGVKEASEFARTGFREAAQRPTAVGRAARGVRTMLTLPVAAVYGAAKKPMAAARRVGRTAKEFGTELMGAEYQPPTRPDVSRAGAPIVSTAPSGEISPVIEPGAEVPARRRGLPDQVPGAGIIRSGSGALIMGPGGEMRTEGVPTLVSDTGAPLPSVPDRVSGRAPRRMTLEGGGYFFPERVTGQKEEPLKRISDIPAPKTIGGVPVYRRQVEALEADIAAQQRADQLAQQQRQFEAGQAQQQRQFEAGQAQQQQQFETGTALKARQLAGTEQRQQAELELRQQQEVSRQEQQAKLNEAVSQFTTAKTPQERNKAAAMINAMSGKGLKAEKSSAPMWKPKEVSDAVGSFEKSFREAKQAGLIEKEAGLHRMLMARDPGLYRAAFGRMNPQAAEFGERVMTMPLDKLKADPDFKRKMKEMGDEVDAEQLRAQLIADYMELSEGR